MLFFSPVLWFMFSELLLQNVYLVNVAETAKVQNTVDSKIEQVTGITIWKNKSCQLSTGLQNIQRSCGSHIIEDELWMGHCVLCVTQHFCLPWLPFPTNPDVTPCELCPHWEWKGFGHHWQFCHFSGEWCHCVQFYSMIYPVHGRLKNSKFLLNIEKHDFLGSSFTLPGFSWKWFYYKFAL